MEYLLLLAILVILIILKSDITSKINNLTNRLEDSNRKLDKLLKDKSLQHTTVKKPVDKEAKIPQSIVKEPPFVSKPKPVIIPDVKAREVKPAFVISEKTKEKPFVKSSNETIKEQIKPPKLTYWERFKLKNPDLEKFIGENLINKIGILILVLGVSYFVKFAIDKDWINEPARVGIGILAGSLVLFLAHKLRQKYSSFSSVLVSGAIAIFYFTIGIAFHEYQLFSQTVAFVIMVFITAFSCLISVSYNRVELAVLSLIGGFAVPFMVSSGSGNYIVLFTYIAVLDIGILVLSYFKKWNLVGRLAFVFTNVLFIGWLVKELFQEEPHYLGAFIFAFIFYMIFMITNVINNLRTKGKFSKSELAILTTNTFVFYGIGMFILQNYQPQFLGLFTAVLALLNLGFAGFLYKKFGLDKTTVYVFIGLTLTFITLAIPVQFHGYSITLFWAIEAILLMWLAQKSKIKEYRFMTVFVQVLMLVSLFMDWSDLYNESDNLQILINPVFATGISAIISLLGVRYLLRDETIILEKYKLVFNPLTYKNIAPIIAIVVAYFVGFFEVNYQSNVNFDTVKANAIVSLYHLFFTAILCFFLYRKKTGVNYKILNSIAIFNVVLFAFAFSKIPFLEQRQNLLLEEGNQIAFYLHYGSLTLIFCFLYLIYATNKKKRVFELFENRLFTWISIFLVVFILSSELILHSLQIMNADLVTEMSSRLQEEGQSINTYRKTSLLDNVISNAKIKVIKTALPVLWGVLAFVFLLIGIKKNVKELRIIALTLLGITIVKLFTYDISNVSETGKIIAFILLGVLILTISFVYQRIKTFVIDDDKNKKDEKMD